MPRSWRQVWHDVKSKYWLTKQSLKLHTPPARGALRSCQTKFATKCKYQICFPLKLLRCRSNPVNWLHSSSSVTSSCFSGCLKLLIWKFECVTWICMAAMRCHNIHLNFQVSFPHNLKQNLAEHSHLKQITSQKDPGNAQPPSFCLSSFHFSRGTPDHKICMLFTCKSDLFFF